MSRNIYNDRVQIYLSDPDYYKAYLQRNLKGKEKERNYAIITDYLDNNIGLFQVGRTYHISKERVRQIVSQALYKVQKYSKKKPMTEEKTTLLTTKELLTLYHLVQEEKPYELIGSIMKRKMVELQQVYEILMNYVDKKEGWEIDPQNTGKYAEAVRAIWEEKEGTQLPIRKYFSYTPKQLTDFWKFIKDGSTIDKAAREVGIAEGSGYYVRSRINKYISLVRSGVNDGGYYAKAAQEILQLNIPLGPIPEEEKMYLTRDSLNVKKILTLWRLHNEGYQLSEIAMRTGLKKEKIHHALVYIRKYLREEIEEEGSNTQYKQAIRIIKRQDGESKETIVQDGRIQTTETPLAYRIQHTPVYSESENQSLTLVEEKTDPFDRFSKAFTTFQEELTIFIEAEVQNRLAKQKQSDFLSNLKNRLQKGGEEE